MCQFLLGSNGSWLPGTALEVGYWDSMDRRKRPLFFLKVFRNVRKFAFTCLMQNAYVLYVFTIHGIKIRIDFRGISGIIAIWTCRIRCCCYIYISYLATVNMLRFKHCICVAMFGCWNCLPDDPARA